jgi:hypothetical protein
LANFILIFVCLGAGILIGRLKSLPANSHKILNDIIINISLPALALLYVPQIKITGEIVYPLVSMWIVFFAVTGILMMLAKVFKWNKATTGALILTAGLCNSSFVGFPILMALFGEEGLKVGVIVDQAGSFTVLATGGVIVASLFSSGKYSSKKIMKDILIYPPFIAFMIGAVLNYTGFVHTSVTKDVLEKLGTPIYLLALISVGIQLKFSFKEISVRDLSIGLVLKLMIAPAIIYLLFAVISGGRGLNVQVSIIESAMAPMVMGSVMAVTHNLNPRLANLMVGLGIPVSFITLAFWYLIIKGL